MSSTEEMVTRPPAAVRLDPSIRRFVEIMGEAWAHHPDLSSVTPAEARRIAEEVRAPWAAGGPDMAETSDHLLDTPHGSARVRLFDPGLAAPKPLFIYLHGGGWTLFSVDTHDRLMREYAARAQVVVAGVEYALSPEAKYPVALDQVVAVACAVAERGAGWGIDPKRISIGGDSAGANLALAACLRLRDEGSSRLIRSMVLNYGVFDRRASPAAIQRFGGSGNMLTHDEMEGFWRNYLSDESEADDPLVSPLRADLQGLPPALVVVPECDLLSEQSIRLVDRMQRAGTPVDLRFYPGATHSFLEAASISSLARQALSDTAAWLRGTLALPPE